jgi:hypothetical protein
LCSTKGTGKKPHESFRKKKEVLKVKQPEPKEEWTVGKIVLGALGAAVSLTSRKYCLFTFPGGMQVCGGAVFLALRMGSTYVRIIPGAIYAAGPLGAAAATVLGFVFLRFGPGLSYRTAMIAVAAPFPLGVATIVMQDWNSGHLQALKRQGGCGILVLVCFERLTFIKMTALGVVAEHLQLERVPHALPHTTPATTGTTEVEYVIPVSNLGEEYGGFDSKGDVVVTAKRGWLSMEWEIIRIQVFEGTGGHESQKIFDLVLPSSIAVSTPL